MQILTLLGQKIKQNIIKFYYFTWIYLHFIDEQAE